MRVLDMNQDQKAYESLQTYKGYKSKFSLQFMNPKIEKDYTQMILSDEAATYGINYAEKSLTFKLTYVCVNILFLSSYISTYLESQTNLQTSLFQILTLVCVIFVTIAINFIIYKKLSDKFTKSVFLVCSYIFFTEIIVINSCIIKKVFENKSIDYGFVSILGLLPVFYTSKFAIFSSFRTYLLVNTLISITYLLTSLFSYTNTQRTLIEYLFLQLILIIESQNFYIQESLLRDKFLNVHPILSSENKVIEDKSPKTDIEAISQAVKEAIQIIPLLSQQKSKTLYVQKLFENLTKVMGLLGNRNSVYSVDIEGLDNGIDTEDKKFLEETCIAPSRSQGRNSTKFLVRKTIEILKNFEVDELIGILKRIGKEWNFDIFFLKDCSKNKPLSAVGQYCLQKFHLDISFLIPRQETLFFFDAIEEQYKPNPYHNSTHASDVLCSYIYLVQQSIFQEFLQDYELLASVIAILGHDVGHPGLTNRFLINSKNNLAIFYNDSSVLEMMHSATVFQTMLKSNHNILGSLNPEINSIVRTLIIEMILATDMAKHFDLIGKFKSKMINSPNLPLNVPEQRYEIMKILTKASDVGHAAKNQELHQKWTALVCEEFFLQGDKEKELGLPVSMYCDRQKTDIGKSQAGFIKNIVLPIFESINLCFGSEQIRENCIWQLEENMKGWEGFLINKRGMSLSIDTDQEKNIKVRTETTIAGRTGRSSLSSLVNY